LREQNRKAFQLKELEDNANLYEFVDNDAAAAENGNKVHHQKEEVEQKEKAQTQITTTNNVRVIDENRQGNNGQNTKSVYEKVK
jgi:hypothetical protein